MPAEPEKGMLPSESLTVCLQVASRSAAAEGQAALSWSLLGLLQGGRRLGLFWGFDAGRKEAWLLRYLHWMRLRGSTYWSLPVFRLMCLQHSTGSGV